MSRTIDYAFANHLEAQDRARGGTISCLVLSAAALGYAIQRRDGLFDPGAFWFLSISLVLCACGALGRFKLPGRRWVDGLIGCAIAWQFLQMFLVTYPGSWHGPVADATYRSLLTGFGLPVLGMVIALASGKAELARRLFFPLALLGFTVLACWLLRTVPHPFSDVYEAQRAGLVAFCSGKSAYNAPFPDIYNYPPGFSPGTIVRNGMVELGFPYPPLSLLMDLPGHVIMGDFRYSNLIAMVGAAALIGYMKRGTTPLLAGMLFLSTGRSLFVLETGFTEPGVALLLAATLFAAVRGWRVTPVLLGLLFASKQYLVIIAPCALLLVPGVWEWRKALRWVLVAGAVALLVSLPIILVDLAAFVRCTITPIAKAHFRKDGLSYLALYAYRKGVVPNAMIGFGLAAVALPLVLWPRCANARLFCNVVFAGAVPVLRVQQRGFLKLLLSNHRHNVGGRRSLSRRRKPANRIYHARLIRLAHVIKKWESYKSV